MSGKDKWVRRFSVDETARHKNGFTIYKITSVIFPLQSPEAVTVVCVWKRYSDALRLHRGMCALHGGLQLPGKPPTMPKTSYFRRFHKEVIEERAKAIKIVLEFVAEHRLLFTSTEFVRFLESGYPWGAAPARGGVIDAIRSALQLPREPAPPLEYPDDERPQHTLSTEPQSSRDETDLAAIPRIPIHEAATTELPTPAPSRADSFDSIISIDGFNDTFYEEMNTMTVEKKSAVKKRETLPDLIIFDAPSCSSFEDYHDMRPDAASIDSTAPSDRVSLSASNLESKTRTEDSYVFEAGHLMNLAGRCEDAGDYPRAFEFYKSGIEMMLIGAQADTNPQRRALIKEKTNKYLAYAEDIYKNHLCNAEESSVCARAPPRQQWAVPLSMLRRPYEELARYRVLAVLAHDLMLALHTQDQACLAIKVIQKIPNNLTEFDEYYLHRPNETRQPILPTNIPYMVPLQAYIETNSLIFLILTYAPGEKLIDYINNYIKSAPTTPARELNLENVFSEPLKKEHGVKRDIKPKVTSVESVSDKLSEDSEVDEVEVMLKNSQRLLQDVDKALNEQPGDGDVEVHADEVQDRRAVESPSCFRLLPRARSVLPASALCKWGAQILTAIEALHNAGVICRDLNSSNVLLGDGGQALLTYAVGREADVALAGLARAAARGAAPLHAAPELLRAACPQPAGAHCDYWSYGCILYELHCGRPLSYYHKSVFTSHTLLILPEDLPVEVESLLTQLLTYDPAERLGYGGIDEIKQHPYFKNIDWTAILDSWIVPG